MPARKELLEVAGREVAVDAGKLVIEIKNAHSDTVYGVCFSPDGNIVQAVPLQTPSM